MRLPDRDSALDEFLQQYVLEGWLGDLPIIEKNYEEHKEHIEQGLIDALREACRRAGELQSAGQKGPIRYMYISLLRTAIMNNQPTYRIDCYDERWFLDHVECTVHWDATFTFQPLFDRMKQLDELRRPYGRRITVMDIEKIQQIEAVKYHTLTVEFIKSMMPVWVEHPDWTRLTKAAGCAILAGEFRDESELLCQLEDSTEAPDHQVSAEQKEAAEQWTIFS
ncbi:hypothetical protein [Paenibacillus bovis]|uniref:Uncharacterized protein n=1 Tax=Paenibacillus bovis TaxID=1616788 RepID=A0A172ZI03_9BACL|nr:hypothetical protein [Paenibacillus bovis]ANF97265.1 hypothetical protein AR543_15495 [Paenibacillus bovis]